MEKLIDFLKYVRENHLEDVARQSLKDSREMKLPILELFAHLSDEELLPQSIKGINDFVDSLIDGSYEQKQINNLKLWEEDKLPGISKNDIQPIDLVLIYVIQKKSYFKFLPFYTKDTQLVIDIVIEMEQMHLASQMMGIDLLFKIRTQQQEEINKLNHNLQQNIEQLEQVNGELESFSYSVSHDLRAPLRAIHGYTKILKEEYQDKLNEEARKMMRAIMNNTEKMANLIDDLLAFSRMGKKELQVTKLNMTELAKTAWIETRKSSPDLKTKITINSLLPVKADNGLMFQVFSNLISNAVKYSHKKDNPVVEITSFEKDDECVYCVKDNGIGFDMKYYDKLFGVFQRLHNNNEFEGTGIGLALVKRILSKHGGKIWAEAELGKGATFYFSLNK